MNERHEVLFNQLATYRSELIGVAQSVTAEEAESIPNGFNNNIRWNLGHVYLDQYLWIQAVTKEKASVPAGFQSWFGYGTSPADFTEETPSLEELIQILQKQPEDIREAYGERLEEELAPTEMGMHTIEQVLIRTIFHEGMHLQVILDIKKCLYL
ncbi:DinB family protein [Robertmurraya yapensis]|uniref:DinB family protein n=1 Tax=Bacillus yapensis TaxID=2492960 RepID=A0A431WE90_9BACI|nr:DinB family protein [Bacillus yapensis]RTR33860.1 DinB family protein [Bacillus yapensis]TKS97178.1 DinB family protein [Bacillus yapensis]